MTKDEKQVIELAKKLALEFLTQMGLDAEISTSTMKGDEGKGDYVQITLNGDHLHELIGHHGKNLEAVQIVLGLLINKQLDAEKQVRVIVEINDYRQSREKYLQSYALRAADQVKQSGQDFTLPPMKPFERRVIHMTLAEHSDVTTESMGEGEDRHIIIKPK